METPLAKRVVGTALVEAVEKVVQAAVDPRGLDIAFASRQRARQYTSGNIGYGMDYSPVASSFMRDPEDILDSHFKSRVGVEDGHALIASCEQTLMRHHSQGTPEEQISKYRKEFAELRNRSDSHSQDTTLPPDWDVASSLHNEDDADDKDLQVIGTLPADKTGERGLCETLWLLKEKSQPHLIAMAQGMFARTDDPMWPGIFVFDLDVDERLKSFPQRSMILPKLHHLSEEATRRATVLGTKPIRKAARKNELIAWLKLNPIVDDKDVKFVKDECNKTYRAIMEQLDDMASAERTALASRNWTSLNWLRLYCCAIDDHVRPYMLTKDDCMVGITKKGLQLGTRR
jgi:hypothetical protein